MKKEDLGCHGAWFCTSSKSSVWTHYGRSQPIKPWAREEAKYVDLWRRSYLEGKETLGRSKANTRMSQKKINPPDEVSSLLVVSYLLGRDEIGGKESSVMKSWGRSDTTHPKICQSVSIRIVRTNDIYLCIIPLTGQIIIIIIIWLN